eukprot:gene1591-12716_t
MKFEITFDEIDEEVENFQHNFSEGDKIEIDDDLGYFVLKNGSTTSVPSPLDGILTISKPFQKNNKMIYGIIDGCDHSEIFHNMCGICGKKIENEKETKLISIVHNQPEFKIKEKKGKLIYEEEKNILLKKKKLSLVLDLDLTLLHTTNDEKFLEIVKLAKSKDVHEFKLNNKLHLTKLRPNLKEFFSKLQNLFEFHIFTHGIREYANEIAKIIDPDETLFKGKIISREECPNEKIKTLNDIFPSSNPNTVLIIDDNFTVWKNNLENLILISPFNFFNSNHTLSKNKDDQLDIISNLLIQIHSEFFKNEKNLESQSVQNLLSNIQKNVFKNLNIYFYGFDFGPNKDIRDTQIGFISKYFGCTIFEYFDSKITHIVSRGRFNELEKYKGVFLVHESWFYHSAYKFNKLEEIDYLMYQSRVVLPIKQHYPDVNLTEFQQLANQLIKKIHKTNLYLESKNKEVVTEDDDFLNDLTDSDDDIDDIDDDEEEDLEKLLEEALDDEEVALSESGIHTPIQQGINGYGSSPAASVVSSASSKTGYDERGDSGMILIYSGQGTTGDQELTRFNESLYYNMKEKIPVRLIRRSTLNGKYAPKSGYRSDGLYWVTKIFTDFLSERVVYQFRLVQVDLSYVIPCSEYVPKEILVEPINPIIKKEKTERIIFKVAKSIGLTNMISPEKKPKIEKQKRFTILDDDDDDFIEEKPKVVKNEKIIVDLNGKEEEELSKRAQKKKLKELELDHLKFEEAIKIKEKINELKKKRDTLKRFKLFNPIFFQHLNDLLDISVKYKIVSLFEEIISELVIDFDQFEKYRSYFFLYLVYSNKLMLWNDYQFDISKNENILKIYEFLCLNNFVGLSNFSKNFNKIEMSVYRIYLKKISKKFSLMKKNSIKEEE